MIQHVQINLMRMKTKLFSLLWLLLATTTLNAQVGTVLESANDLSLDCNLEVSIASTVLTCGGANVCVAIRGGVPPYTILFGENNPRTEDNLELCFRNLQPGNYRLKVTDAENCEAGIDINIPVVDYLLEARVEHVSCFGSSDGAIHLDIPIDLAPLFFHWEGPDGYTADTESIENLAAGVYSVSVTTLNNLCVGIGSWVVRQPDPINIRVDITQPDCGQPDACVFVSGGAQPYYIWAFENLPPGVADSPNGRLSDFTDLDPGAGVPYDPTTSDTAFCANNVPDGIYYLLVIDINLCYAWKRLAIEGSLGLERRVEMTPANCREYDGEICFKVEGGTPPYNTYLTNVDEVIVEDNGCFSALRAGHYKLVTTDSEGCSIEEEIIVRQVSDLEANFEITSDVCEGQVDGCLTVEGGTRPYRVFVWHYPGLTDETPVDVTYDDNGNPVIVDAQPIDYVDFTLDPDTDNTNPDYRLCARDIPPGRYIVLVADANRCYDLLRVYIPDLNLLEVDFEITSEACSEQVDGCLKVQGGTQAYNIWVWTWDNPNTVLPEVRFDDDGRPRIENTNLTDDVVFSPTDDDPYVRCAENIPPGYYLVLVVDANGCYVLLPVLIPQPNGLALRTEVRHIGCSGEEDGAIKLAIENGVPPFTIVLNGEEWGVIDESTIVFEDLGPGTYEIEVADANQCTGVVTVNLEEADPLEMDLDYDPYGSFACVEPFGGTSPYTYLWFDLNNNTRIGRDSCVRNLPEGAYMVVIRDARACSVDEILIIDPMPCIGGEAIVDPEIINSGESTIFKLVNHSGFSIQWQFKTDFTNWLNIPGATEDEYETPAINTGSDKVILVRAQVICSNGDAIYSNEAELKVVANDQLRQINEVIEDHHLFNPDFRRAALAQLEHSYIDSPMVDAKVYPTIVRDLVQIQLEGVQDQIVRIDVHNELGYLVKQQIQHNYYSGESIELTMNELTAGTYFVRITNGSQVISKRIFIIH